MDKEKRKTVITKAISRKIQTAKYENIQISVSVEEEIDWANLDEKNKKHQAVTKVLLNDYKQTEKDVLKELDLMNKPASVGGIKNNENMTIKTIDLDD